MCGKTLITRGYLKAHKTIKVTEFNEIVKELQIEPQSLSEYRSKLLNEINKGVKLSEAKKSLKPLKMLFPVFVPCVTDALAGGNVLESQNLYQIDIDSKDSILTYEKASEIKKALIDTDSFFLVALSCSYGVKAFIKARGGNYRDVAKVLYQRIEKLLIEKGFNGFKIDEIPESQCCFFPYDKELYYNSEAKTYNVEIRQKPTPPVEEIKQTILPPATLSRDEFERRATLKAANISRKKGSLSEHKSRALFITLCYKFGVSCEKSYELGNEIESLDLDYVIFSRRYNTHERSNRSSFGESSGEIIEDYLKEKERQINYRNNNP